MTCPFGALSCRRRKCVAPLQQNPAIEIRPSRYLRIQHFNARPRDEKFENEMHIYIQYKQKGIPTCDLLSLPRRQHKNNNHQHNTLTQHHSLPLTVEVMNHEMKHEKYISITDKQVDNDIVIFFIHGVGGSSDIWCSQIRYFSDQGYEIVAPDLIGHGFSYSTKDAKAYHFKEIAADMEEIFDRYCKKKNVLIGHSYGASFATFLARNRPRHVTKLILISGGPPSPLKPQPGVFSLPNFLIACIKPCLLCKFYKDAFYNKRTSVIPKEEAFNIPAYVLQHTMNGQDWPDGDEIYHEWITCPCLLIYGAQDQLVSLQDEEEMAKVIYGSRLEVIEDVGHMVMIEAPEEVSHLIDGFISQPAAVEPQKTNQES